MSELLPGTGWRATSALRPFLVVGGAGIGGAMVLGEPGLCVLVDAATC